MAYDKEEINRVYKNYVESRSEKELEELIILCEPIMDYLLDRWKKYAPYCEDFKQEMRLKLWLFLKKKTYEQLATSFINPVVLLYNRLQDFFRDASRKLEKVYDSNVDFVSIDERQLELIRNDFADPEFLYYFRYERPQELFNSCVEKLKKHPVLKNNSLEQTEAIWEIRKKIEEFFGIKLDI